MTKRTGLNRVLIILFCGLAISAACHEQARRPDTSTAALAAAETEVRAVSAVNEPTPQITFENVLYDFGEISAAKSHEGQFKFTNTGDALLKISEVQKCCGAVVTLDKEELAPGQSTLLNVQYRAGSSPGRLTRQLHVKSNDPANPSVALTLKGMIVQKVACEPRNLNVRLKGPDAGCPPITITSLDGQPFSITSVRASRDALTADFDPAVEAAKFVLHPKVDFEKLRGAPAGIISIGLTHPESERVTTYFRPVPEFKLTPPSLILTNAEPDKPITRKVYVQSNYNEDFDVESASSQKGFTRLIDKRKIGSRWQLEVELTPPAEDGTGKFDDLLSVKLQDGQKLQLKVYGRSAKQTAALRQQREQRQAQKLTQ